MSPCLFVCHNNSDVTLCVCHNNSNVTMFVCYNKTDVTTLTTTMFVWDNNGDVTLLTAMYVYHSNSDVTMFVIATVMSPCLLFVIPTVMSPCLFVIQQWYHWAANCQQLSWKYRCHHSNTYHFFLLVHMHLLSHHKHEHNQAWSKIKVFLTYLIVDLMVKMMIRLL